MSAATIRASLHDLALLGSAAQSHLLGSLSGTIEREGAITAEDWDRAYARALAFEFEQSGTCAACAELPAGHNGGRCDGLGHQRALHGTQDR